MFAKMYKYLMGNFVLVYLLLTSSILLRMPSAYSLEAPQVNIADQGVVIGTYLKMYRTHTIKAYLGIQYARSSRFTPPEIRTFKGNIINATSFGPDCWQKPQKVTNNQTAFVHQLLYGNKNSNPNERTYDENCLYLNIYVPIGIPSKDGYAVVVWIHSGDFSQGHSDDINPFQMVFKQKVIVVTFSYRLNIFGFLSTGDGESQGNFGLMDQSAALFWIRKNINFFGGNDNHITIMGHSAGAVSVGLHLTSRDWSRDAFHKAIIMSGLSTTEKTVHYADEFQSTLDSIASIFGCIRKPASLFIQCLKRVDAKILTENIPFFEWGPVVDFGLSNISLPFVEDLPTAMFQKRAYQKVPVLVGVTDMEDVLFITDDMNSNMITEDFDLILKNIAMDDLRATVQSDMWCSNFHIVVDALNYIYQNPSKESADKDDDLLAQNFVSIHTDRVYIAPLFDLADMLSREEKVFVYIFNIKPKLAQLKMPEWMKVPKYFDQLYVWGAPFMDNGDLGRDWSSVDKKIADIVMTLWANFIRNSNPAHSNVAVPWLPYSSTNNTYLEINEQFSAKTLSSNYNYKIDFWNKYYPNVLKFAAECCNMTNDAATHSHVPLDYLYIFQQFVVVIWFLVPLIVL